ncbi:hypothetical protein DFR24_1706 [Panacagrimonas perspica]|uniref:Uncharacterized protein n=1 Tax=Panacagrimonas perspica TaxID=381431 RepID=A0A4S3KA97_9GAMM|nr:hypothetical protein [Panacagrimonas perspica]TDU32312.1 hypothetical protein DFR24_1706 [Panacagrimonas perspica]THD05252.1 hypothetical protein B1810_00415 [Panacagrimonas perspica]
MKLCDPCARLLLAPTRNDIPTHLHLFDPSTGKMAAAPKARLFDCETCDSRWGWKEVTGWHLKTPNRSARDAEDAAAPS